MARHVLIFMFCTLMIASCKCGDKQADDTTTTATTTSTQTNSDASANLQAMSSAAANTEQVNKEPNEPGEEEMNRMYGTGAEARKQMAKRNTMRKSGSMGAGYYPEGSERKLTQEDIKYLTPWGQKIMLNEIYARHGMTFKDEQLQRHFENKPWYHANSANVYEKLTPMEKQNISFLINTGQPKEMHQEGVAAN